MKQKPKEKIMRAMWGDPEKLLKVGNYEVECYVLEDGTSVLSQGGMYQAIGLGKQTDDNRKSPGPKLARFLSTKQIYPFISNELATSLKSPILFTRPGRGGSKAQGFKAALLIDLCEAIIHSFQNGQLPQYYMPVLMQAQLITTGFAKAGIDAAIWDITGYIKDKNRKTIQDILDKYLREEYAKWAKRFPDEFWIEIFRLKGWPWSGMKINRPSIVGRIVNNVVYSRLAPDVLKKLRELNPRIDGRRKYKHHQFLTEDIGHPALQQHLHAVLALMRASTNWLQFERYLARSFPEIKQQLFLEFEDED